MSKPKESSSGYFFASRSVSHKKKLWPTIKKLNLTGFVEACTIDPNKNKLNIGDKKMSKSVAVFKELLVVKSGNQSWSKMVLKPNLASLGKLDSGVPVTGQAISKAFWEAKI